jgi:hypothetical protein
MRRISLGVGRPGGRLDPSVCGELVGASRELDVTLRDGALRVRPEPYGDGVPADRDVRVVVLGFRELGEAGHEGDRLPEVGEAKAALERAPHLVPALGIVGVGQSGHGPESYHTVSSIPKEAAMTRKLVLVAVATTAVALVSAGAASARTFYGIVGPGFTITLKNAAGKRVTQIKKGTHTIRVNDKSSGHNFHLIGPGINRKTRVAFVGRRRWTLRFAVATYVYRCDPHRGHMRGSFRAVR